MKKIGVLTLNILVVLFLTLNVFAMEQPLRVFDEVGVLSPETIQEIGDINLRFDNSEKKPEYAVLIIDKIPNGYNIDSYKTKRFNELGVGKQEENNGILLLISVSDRKIGVEPGIGLKELFSTDNARNQILNQKVMNLLSDDNFDSAVLEISKNIENYTNSNYINTSTIPNQEPDLNLGTKKTKNNYFIILEVASIAMIFYLSKDTSSYEERYEAYLKKANAENKKEYYDYYSKGEICDLIKKGKEKETIEMIKSMDFNKSIYEAEKRSSQNYASQNVEKILLQSLGVNHAKNINLFVNQFSYNPKFHTKTEKEIKESIEEQYLDYYIDMANKKYEWGDNKTKNIRRDVTIEKIRNGENIEDAEKMNEFSPASMYGDAMFFHAYLLQLSDKYDANTINSSVGSFSGDSFGGGSSSGGGFSGGF